MKNVPNSIKKVKIDEHIKNSKKTAPIEIKKPRGRPKKDASGTQTAPIKQSVSSMPEPAVQSPPSASSGIGNSQAQIPSVMPQYDTTEEAKAFISMPFEAIAAVTKNKDLKLSTAELEAVCPSFKTVYDKRIAPYLGANADLVAFGVVMAGLCASKLNVHREFKATQKKASDAIKQFDGSPSAEAPLIPVQVATV